MILRGKTDMESNLCFVSNVYPCQDDCVSDSAFLKEVRDYDKLKNMKQAKYSSAFPAFSVEQEKIISEGTRCIGAKNDPCWGFVKKNGKEIWMNKCIQTECSHFRECRSSKNPYDAMEKKEFSPSAEEIEKYGNPKELRVYYLINAVKKKAETSYFNNPESDAKRYAVKKKDDEIEKERKVIGYQKQRFSDYCDEQYEPIYEDEVIHKKNYGLSKYGSSGFNIAKYLSMKAKEEAKNEENKKPVYESFESVGKSVRREEPVESKRRKSSTLDGIVLREKVLKSSKKDLEMYLGERQVCIVLQSEIEMQYLASLFIKREIAFSIKTSKENIVLSYLDDSYIPDCECIVLETILDSNKKPFLEKQRGFIEGRTSTAYVILHKDDFVLSNEWNGNSCEVECYKDFSGDNVEYYVQDFEGKCIGKMTKSFVDDIEELSPAVIAGFRLEKSEDGYEIYGIGHMEYDEY